MKLNLDDLTQEKVDEATPHMMHGCSYAAPCIIGTLIPEDQREKLDGVDGGYVKALIAADAVEFPNRDQEQEAIALQRAFDRGHVGTFEALLAERGLKLNRDLLPSSILGA